MSNITTRTFSINISTCDKLAEISSDFGLTKNTIIRMAIYHGISIIDNGYIPQRNKDNHKKKKVKVSMSDNCWKELYRIQQESIDKWMECIPDGELISLFIDMELSKYKEIIDYEEEDKTHNWKIELSEGVTYAEQKKITITVPDKINKELHSRIDFANVSEIQFWKYIVAQGIMQEYNMMHFDMIYSDVDIIQAIEKLGLPKITTMTLLAYLRDNGRIFLNMGKWRGNWESEVAQNKGEK